MSESSPATPPANEQTRSLAPHVGVLLISAGLFALVARAVATKRTRAIDERAEEWLQARCTPAVDAAAKPVTLLSLPLVAMSATLSLAWWMRAEKRGAASLALAVAPLLAATAGQSFTTFLPQQSPPDATDSSTGNGEQAGFPSGHTTGITTEALTIGYILVREDLSSPSRLVLLAALPLFASAARLYRNRHWMSDAVAGLIAGVGVTAVTTMIYETARANS